MPQTRPHIRNNSLAPNTCSRCLLKFILLPHPHITTQGIYIFIGNIWPPQDTPTMQHVNKLTTTTNWHIIQYANRIKIYGDHTHNSKHKWDSIRRHTRQKLQHKYTIGHAYIVTRLQNHNTPANTKYIEQKGWLLEPHPQITEQRLKSTVKNFIVTTTTNHIIEI